SSAVCSLGPCGHDEPAPHCLPMASRRGVSSWRRIGQSARCRHPRPSPFGPQEQWQENDTMQRSSIAGLAFAVFAMTGLRAKAQDAGKYPDLGGQWSRVPNPDPPRYDPSKPIRGQEAPLKEEYRLRHEASMKDQDDGGFGLDLNYSCIAQTMPRLMN